MPISLNDIAGTTPPAAPVAPPVAPEPAAESSGVPQEVLQIPAFRGLLEGSPSAVLSPNNNPDPDVQTVMKNFDALQGVGFGLYRTKDGQNNVFFNSRFISPEEVKKADSEGKLDEIAVPFDALKASFDAAMGTPAAAPAPAPAMPMAPSAPPSNRNLTAGRIKNAVLGSPTSGPYPGGGRIQNAIAKPVV